MTNSGAWLKKIALFFTWTSYSFYFRSLYLAIKKILSNDFAYGLLEDLTFFLYFLKKKKKERKKEISWFIHIVALEYTFRVKGTILRQKSINHFGV